MLTTDDCDHVLPRSCVALDLGTSTSFNEQEEQVFLALRAFYRQT
jgi:hypothetical protein